MVDYTDITLLQPFLVRLGQMAGLTECETKVIAGVQFSIMHIRRGHNFIERGATPKYLFSILDGWVGRYNVRPDGSRRITGFMLPGEFSGIHALYHTPIDHTIVALTDCIILKLDATRVKDLIIRYPLIERALWRAKLIDEAILRTWLTNSSNALRTLAHLLCELDFRQEAVQVSAPHDFKLPITQQNLADALGLTSVHVNRTLHALQLKELIKVRYGNVSLIDIETLRQFAFFDSTYLS